MKAIIFFLLFLVHSCASGKEMDYTASTPADRLVRSFLGISQTDSIDFIRWKLKIVNLSEFKLFCSYGMSKPNTNGFVNKKTVELKGNLTSKDDIYTLSVGGRSLLLQGLNNNILHILNEDKTMMVGNGGWSYTLNSIEKIETEELNLRPQHIIFKDSMIFDGRTPCKLINDILDLGKGSNCYKIKWRVFLYRDSPSASTGSYKIAGTELRTGKWKLKETGTRSIIYSLDLNNGHTLDLLHADSNVIYMMNEKNSILVGDEDFSFSLNRIKK